MWGKSRIDEEETAKVASSRLITVLGLDKSEGRERVSPLPARSAPEPINDLSDRRFQTPAGQNSEEDISCQKTTRASATTCLEDGPAKTEELHPSGENSFAELNQKSETSLERRARAFEENLSRIGTRSLSQLDANVRQTASPVESCVAETHEMELTMDESLANLARKMTEAAQGQISILEESLANIAEQVGSRIQSEFEPLAKRVESYHAQAEEVNSSLENALARFSQRVEDAGKAQAWLFDEKIKRISEQAVTQAQENIQSGITQLRDTATQSFEERMAALGESIERRLKENFEAWSKMHLEMVQQQVSKLSSDLLSQMRTESESIAQYLHARLKSDAQHLEAKTFEGMHGKLQKVTEEFRSVLERALA